MSMSQLTATAVVITSQCDKCVKVRYALWSVCEVRRVAAGTQTGVLGVSCNSNTSSSELHACK